MITSQLCVSILRVVIRYQDEGAGVYVRYPSFAVRHTHAAQRRRGRLDESDEQQLWHRHVAATHCAGVVSLHPSRG